MFGRLRLLAIIGVILSGLLGVGVLGVWWYRTKNVAVPVSSSRIEFLNPTVTPNVESTRRLVVTSNVGGDPRFAAIGYSVLNGLKVASVDLQNKALDVVYTNDASEMELRVPMIGTVEAFQSDGQELTAQGLASLSSLDLKAGQIVNIGFIYVKPGYQMTVGEARTLCDQVNYHNCQDAIRNGFGSVSTDFEKYISSLGGGGDKTLDIKLVYPTSIAKL